MPSMQAVSGSLVAVSSLREFFRDAFHAASEHQHLDIDEQAEQYVVNLLTMFSRADALYERTPEGLRIRPLAQMLADALEAPTATARQRGLQRLGDVSLFIAGFFTRSSPANFSRWSTPSMKSARCPTITPTRTFCGCTKYG